MPASNEDVNDLGEFPWFSDDKSTLLTNEGSTLARQIVMQTQFSWRVRFGEIVRLGIPTEIVKQILQALCREEFLVPCPGPYNKNNYMIARLFRVKAIA